MNENQIPVLKAVPAGAPELEQLERINEEAIPAEERNTLTDLRKTGAEILGIFLQDIPAGFLVLRSFRQTCYLAYLAVRQDLRGQGIGSLALAELLCRNAGRQIAAEFESPDAAPEDRMRQRRKDFYLRNGFCETGWHTRYDGTEFEIACAGRPFDAAEFSGFVRYLGTLVSDHIPTPFRRYAGFVLREAEQTDIPELCRLRLAYLAEDMGELSAENREQITAQLPHYFAEHLGRDCFAFTAALPDGTLAANAILLCTEKPANPFFPNGRDGTVLGVYTMPQYRRKGLAAELMKLLIAEGRAQSLSRITLSATDAGRPVYEKLGFSLKRSHYSDMALTL